MERETFYRKLAAGLTQAGYHLAAGDGGQEGVSSERDATLSAIRQATSVVGALIPNFDSDVVQRHLDMVRAWADIACFKYVLGQPVMIAVVEADRFSADDFITATKRFDRIVLEMLAVTAKLDVGGPGSVRLGAFGILIFVFFDPQAAARFAANLQRKCKIFHFFKKTVIVSWLIDVANGTVKKHHGIPFLVSFELDPDILQKAIFQ